LLNDLHCLEVLDVLRNEILSSIGLPIKIGIDVVIFTIDVETVDSKALWKVGWRGASSGMLLGLMMRTTGVRIFVNA
jgi:hypothetical protein